MAYCYSKNANDLVNLKRIGGTKYYMNSSIAGFDKQLREIKRVSDSIGLNVTLDRTK